MSSWLYIISSVLLLSFSLRNVLFWLYLWQLKEYRVDRMMAHLSETEQGKELFLSGFSLLKSIFLIFLILLTAASFRIDFIGFIILILLLYSNLILLYEIKDRVLKRPVFTFRIVILFFLSGFTLILIYFIPLIYKVYWIFFIEKSIPFVVAFFVAITSLPIAIYKDIIISQASLKRSRFKKLIVIGITGSYGKTSTKECISNLLSDKYNVLKTPESVNTSYSIASLILKNLSSYHEILICEMGAYKRGEIRQISEIVRPSIAVVTGVNPQHESLFGGLEEIKSAKFELVESLSYDALALFNGNSVNCQELYNKTHRRKKILYYASYNNEFPKKADIVASDVRLHKFWTSFDIFIADFKKTRPFQGRDELSSDMLSSPRGNPALQSGEDVIKSKSSRFKIRTNLLGMQAVENLLPAVYLASYFGMNNSTISKLCKNIERMGHRMELYLHINGSTLIDNTYNASSDSVRSCLEYLKLYKGRKIVVFQPMIELGSDALPEHEEIAFLLGKVADYVYLTNRNFFGPIVQGIRKSSDNCKVVQDASLIKEIINEQIGDNDAVLFIGREGLKILSQLSYEKVN